MKQIKINPNKWIKGDYFNSEGCRCAAGFMVEQICGEEALMAAHQCLTKLRLAETETFAGFKDRVDIHGLVNEIIRVNDKHVGTVRKLVKNLNLAIKDYCKCKNLTVPLEFVIEKEDKPK